MTKPYGYARADGQGIFIYGEHQFQNTTNAELVPLYLHPKEWVGLTDGDKASFWTADQMTHEEWQQLFADIEAKLKEKNT